MNFLSRKRKKKSCKSLLQLNLGHPDLQQLMQKRMLLLGKEKLFNFFFFFYFISSTASCSSPKSSCKEKFKFFHRSNASWFHCRFVISFFCFTGFVFIIKILIGFIYFFFPSELFNSKTCQMIKRYFVCLFVSNILFVI